MKRYTLGLVALLIAAPLECVLASPVAEPPEPTDKATIDHTRSFDFVSAENGESYRIKVYIPDGTPPATGYPAIYVLDGGNLFGTFAGAIRNQGGAQERAQAVVVGIEDGPGDNSADRTLDFTPSDLSAYEKKVVVDLGPNPKFGGYEKFMQTIQDEIKPKVRAMVHVDAAHETLLGWSLGGQVAVHTMLVHPGYFTSYVALSPSLWRSDRAVFKEIPGFEKAITDGAKPVSLFLGGGALEEQVSSGMTRWPVDQSKLAAEIKYVRMVGNLRDFAAEVRPFFDKHHMAFESKIFDGETHNTVPWAAVNPIVTFLLPYGHPK
ncbi:alpha/beta hydrolase [Luteibacter flocculans]|uniref:Alpha/beta hydrolase n=1 Tax=Luteibacter flocculans TaxID=2780091 RepID=A0ABY4SWC5_9GAMM|nr:alpha/beta hydrolase-fold protein [Luteibacter flocculans]URL57008.1 alpha/beta hydrolase [Luteibacter flocculans]